MPKQTKSSTVVHNKCSKNFLDDEEKEETFKYKSRWECSHCDGFELEYLTWTSNYANPIPKIKIKDFFLENNNNHVKRTVNSPVLSSGSYPIVLFLIHSTPKKPIIIIIPARSIQKQKEDQVFQLQWNL